MAEELRGAPVARALTEEQAARTEKLKSEGIVPCLAFVRVGERADDVSYQHAAEKRCAKAGIETKLFALPENVTQEELEGVLSRINEDRAIHGCLMFRPLSKALDEEAAASILDPAKDVDGITQGSLYGVFAGRKVGFAPCTAAAVVAMLDHYEVPLDGAKVTVVGRSLVVGRPLAALLVNRNATVTLCHSHTKDLFAETRTADIVVACVGRPEMLAKDAFRPGQTVIDVGMNYVSGHFVGDVAAETGEVVRALTPVPGGVGAVTCAILAEHTIEAAERAKANV